MTYCYWAEFVKSGKDYFRYNTRIYINPINEVENNDCCIGAIIGKNPGSAKPAAADKGIKPIKLDGDKLLPTVRNIVSKSYEAAGIESPQRVYIQVLNLFYLCEPDFERAIKKYQNGSDCKSENQSFPWVWYVWGDAPKKLKSDKDGLFKKNRLLKIESENYFYYDKEKSKVVAERPSESDFAKHTQGLKQTDVVLHIAGLIKSLAKPRGTENAEQENIRSRSRKHL